MNTPITYCGGKQLMVRHILPIIPPHTVYTEVFFGGGVLFWAKSPSKVETINNHSDFVINFYIQLKTNFRELSKLIEASLISRSIHRKALEIKKNQNIYSNVEKAWSFWYLTNWSFGGKIGGGLKYSNEQNSSVPQQLIRKKREFTEILQKRIENTTIENRDALDVLNSRNTVNAFHYLDPPYIGADQGHYKGYTENDFHQLLNFCKKCKGKFILSHYSTSDLEKTIIKNNWNVLRINRPLLANRNNGKNENRVEMLVYNYIPKIDLFNYKNQSQC